MDAASLLSIGAGGVLGPVVTYAVKRIPWVRASGSDELGAAINLGVCVLLFVVAGAVLPHLYEGLPRDLPTWVTYGMAAGGVGTAGNNVYRKRVLPARAGDPDPAPPAS